MTFCLVTAVRAASEREQRQASQPFLIHSQQQVLGLGIKHSFQLPRDVTPSVAEKLLFHKENSERALCSAGTTPGFEYVHPQKEIFQNGLNPKHSDHKDGELSKEDTSPEAESPRVPALDGGGGPGALASNLHSERMIIIARLPAPLRYFGA